MLFHYSAHKKDTKTVFIGGDKKYLPTGFEYKTASKGYLVAEIFRKQLHQSIKIIENMYFLNLSKIVLLISQQPNILQRPYCTSKTKKRVLYITSNKEHCCSFLIGREIKKQE